MAWVVPRNRGEGQDLVVVPTARDGAALRGAQPIAQVPSEATSLVVQPTGGKQRGWLVAWTALLNRGESVSVLGVAPDGSARGVPTDVQRTSDHVKWASVVPTPRGALCLWAEQTAMNDANIFVNALEADGKARGMPSRMPTASSAGKRSPRGRGPRWRWCRPWRWGRAIAQRTGRARRTRPAPWRGCASTPTGARSGTPRSSRRAPPSGATSTSWPVTADGSSRGRTAPATTRR